MAEHGDASPLDVVRNVYETIRLLFLLTLLFVFVVGLSVGVVVLASP